MEPRLPAFLSVSLDPSPAIEAYTKDVDRALLRENVRLTTTERVRKMMPPFDSPRPCGARA